MVAELEQDLEASESKVKPLEEELKTKTELVSQKDERILELEKELEATLKVLDAHRDKKYISNMGRK